MHRKTALGIGGKILRSEGGDKGWMEVVDVDVDVDVDVLIARIFPST